MTFKIVADRLIRDGGPTPFVQSPNFGGRMQPVAIVVHDTAGPSAKSAINTFLDRASKVSAHVVVDFDGTITQMVDFDRVAWHAGKSVLDGRSGCNSFTIGIEIVNPGILNGKGCAWFHKPGQTGYSDTEHCKTPEHGDGCWVPYTAAQIEAVTGLCKALVKAYPTIKQVVPHWHISPRRKVDTNPLFPLAALRNAVFSSQSAPVADVSILQVGSQGRALELAYRRLQELGYPVGFWDGIYGASMETAVFGFERQNGLTVDGRLDAAEQAILHSDKAKAMPIAGREPVTVKDLAQVSRGVSDLVTIKNAGVLTGAAGAAGATVQNVTEVAAPATTTPAPAVDPNIIEHLSQGAEGAGYARTIADSLGGLLNALGSNGWVQIMALGLVTYVVATRVLGFKLDDFKLGRWAPSGRK
jgi:N-acetylmuramoyl-L-alanine amidase